MTQELMRCAEFASNSAQRFSGDLGRPAPNGKSLAELCPTRLVRGLAPSSPCFPSSGIRFVTESKAVLCLCTPHNWPVRSASMRHSGIFAPHGNASIPRLPGAAVPALSWCTHPRGDEPIGPARFHSRWVSTWPEGFRYARGAPAVRVPARAAV
jgi:hypothetical protein